MTYLVLRNFEELVADRGGTCNSQRAHPEPLQIGDWALIYRPNVKDGHSGFCLTSPSGERETAPFGGVILATMMFLLEHEDDKFWHDLVRRANSIASDKFGAPMFGETDNTIKRDPPKMN